MMVMMMLMMTVMMNFRGANQVYKGVGPPASIQNRAEGCLARANAAPMDLHDNKTPSSSLVSCTCSQRS